jgi:murein DD-endopeptidase MepM/ murein hydrolase activator NlpD
MPTDLRRPFLGALALTCALLLPALTAQRPVATVSTAPGTLLRWTAPGTERCNLKGRFWSPLHETCYYPVDLGQRLGVVSIGRSVSGHKEIAHISVEANDYGTEAIDLPDIPQAHPSAADLRRDARERLLLGKVWNRKESPAQFTLPLGPPARPMTAGKSFGVKRIFNGKLAEQLHTGADYPVPVGSPVLAVADGTVVVAQDLFFEGNAVMIDHGDGLISMYFHLSDIKVQVGQEVKKGHTLGSVGSTGRATGPHLWFGVRWHDARINPAFLLENPERIPKVDGTPR